VNEKTIYRIAFEEDKVAHIDQIDHVNRTILKALDVFFLFPAKHFITDKGQVERAFKSIKAEADARVEELKKEGKNLEAERLKRRTSYDLAMIREVGYCNGIENYSRHFSGHAPGEPPDTLLSYFPHKPDGSPDFLTIIDESHVTIPQLGGMYAGDQSRKKTLVEHGFRLPSARDNRPLQFNEFEERVGVAIYTSATPGQFEKDHSGVMVEQVIRPTGLIDPMIQVRPVVEKGPYKGQIFDSIAEAEKIIKKGFRAILTTLTKKMAEDLVDYLKEKDIKAEYLHSDIKTIDRINILTEFRRGKFDVLVGVNLLREGLDLPEVAFIGILDADKEGFLRSETSLIQMIGRAARNVEGHVVIYADVMTGSIERAIRETDRRRAIQVAYNKKHGITPKTIIKAIHDITDQMQTEHKKAVNEQLRIDQDMFTANPKALIKKKEGEMNEAVKMLDFETAALLRDEIQALYEKLEGLEPVKPKVDKKKRLSGKKEE
jgi:excinuclease ABC subunit B